MVVRSTHKFKNFLSSNTLSEDEAHACAGREETNKYISVNYCPYNDDDDVFWSERKMNCVVRIIKNYQVEKMIYVWIVVLL